MHRSSFVKYGFITIALLMVMNIAEAQDNQGGYWKLLGTKVQNFPLEEYKSMGSMSPDNNVKVKYSFEKNAIKIEKQVVNKCLSSYKDDPVKQKNWTLGHDHIGERVSAQLQISGLPDILNSPTELNIKYRIETTCRHGDTFSTMPSITVIDGTGEVSVTKGAKVLRYGSNENTSGVSVDDKSYYTMRKSGDSQTWQVPFTTLSSNMNNQKVYRYIGVALSSSHSVAQSGTPIVYFIYQYFPAKKVIPETEDYCWVYYKSAVYGAYEDDREDDGGTVREKREYNKGVFGLKREYQHHGKTYEATAHGIARGLKATYHPGDEVTVNYDLVSNPDDGPRENAIWARATIRYMNLGWKADNWERYGIKNDTELPGALIDDDNYQIIVVPSGEKYNTVLKNNVVSPTQAGYTNDDEGERKMYIILSCCNMDAVYCYHWAPEKEAAATDMTGVGNTSSTNTNPTDDDSNGTSPAIPIAVGGLIGWAVVKIIRKRKKSQKTVVEKVSEMKKKPGETEKEFVERQIKEDLRIRGVKESVPLKDGEEYKSWRWRQNQFEKATRERDKKHQSYVREKTLDKGAETPEEARKIMDDEQEKYLSDKEYKDRIARNWDIAYKTTYVAKHGSELTLKTVNAVAKSTHQEHLAAVTQGGITLMAGAEELGNCYNEGQGMVGSLVRIGVAMGAEHGQAKLNLTGNHAKLNTYGAKVVINTTKDAIIDRAKGEGNIARDIVNAGKNMLTNGLSEIPGSYEGSSWAKNGAAQLFDKTITEGVNEYIQY